MGGESLWSYKKNIRSFLYYKTEGTGIGLSLCRQIIKRHGGNLYLQESGQGKTLFVIEWPIVPFIPK